MSRVGKVPITLPKGVTANVRGNEVKIKGPKGELEGSFHPDMSITLKEDQLVVSRPSDQRMHRALHGLTRTLLANMVEGVSKGFEIPLDIVGVGYRVQNAGGKLSLQVGYTHPVELVPPAGITLTAEGANRIKVSGIDKELVGRTAAEIRKIHPPDAYKGKGIRYAGDQVRLKPGKAGRAAGKKK